ncbi:MAG: cytochrome c biogenesis protein CcsA [Planctomycetales bacterium]|nr:cytochrome c biogenesis protein CcsA [Planctomycetales bacterium]
MLDDKSCHPIRISPMLTGINITCFAASYAIVLVLEVSRLFFRAPVRWIAIVGFTLAGLVAQSIYLYNLASEELTRGVTLLANWHDWCILAAWVMTLAYFGLAIRRPQNSVGIFVLPLVLIAIGLGFVFRNSQPFAPAQAMGVWRTIHGLALLLGTVSVTLGFAAGLMYLAQSYRLKHKLPPRQGFRLPTLEWLQRFNRESLLLSTVLLAAGLLSGVILNLTRGGTAVSWFSSGVLASAVLFLWLVVATLFEFLYKPARQGRKIAYLTFASFAFLVYALGSVLLSQHGTRDAQTDRTTPALSNRSSDVLETSWWSPLP